MLVQHHEKYEEIHGEDKIVMMEYGEHRKLHARLRKEGKCTIPAKELHKIAHAAYRRTKKGIATVERINKRDGRHHRADRKTISFSENIDINISFIESIRYNIKTGSVSVLSSFKGCEGRKIIWVDI